MKKRMKKLTGIITTLALAAMICMAFAVNVQAETTTSDYQGTTYFIKGRTHTWSHHTNSTKKTAIKNLKVKGDKKCITTPKVMLDSYGDPKYVYVGFRIKKPGKVTITFDEKKSNGDVVKHTYKHTFKYYKNPTTSVKLGSKEISKKFKKEWSYYMKAKDLKGKKITVKAAKGFTCAEINVYDGKNWTNIKNGEKIKNMAKGGYVNIQMRDKEGGYNTICIFAK